jgi:hypothetical protein
LDTAEMIAFPLTLGHCLVYESELSAEDAYWHACAGVAYEPRTLLFCPGPDEPPRQRVQMSSGEWYERRSAASSTRVPTATQEDARKSL